MVLDDGYAWNGCVYRSLSQVAKAMVEVLVETSVTGAEPTGREGIGGDARALRPVVRPPGDAPKDRSLDRLVGFAHSHSVFKELTGKGRGDAARPRADRPCAAL